MEGSAMGRLDSAYLESGRNHPHRVVVSSEGVLLAIGVILGEISQHRERPE